MLAICYLLCDIANFVGGLLFASGIQFHSADVLSSFGIACF
jgi:hypothetical protein